MASIFRTIYESNDSTYSTRNFCAEYSNLEDLEIEPCEFRPTRLSESLATISNLCYEGFQNIDEVSEVLTKLRNTIMESIIYCIKVERSAYHEYIQALAAKANLFMERIVLGVLQECHSQESPSACFSLVKAIHDVVLLMYSFTNPLKIPDSLSGTAPSGIEQPGCTFKIEDLLESTKKLHASILSYPASYGISSLGTSSRHSSVNNTPKQLYKDEAANITNLLVKINLVVINNCVPTVALFTYFEAMFQSDDFTLLELEYFEEFLSHYARINKFCKRHKNMVQFHQQKRVLQNQFFQMLQVNPFRRSNWCTSLQAVNYQQIFVDFYNDIYEENLILERWCSEEGHESTVIRRVRNDKVEKACDCPEDHPPPTTPDFVNFFTRSVLSETEVSPNYFQEYSQDAPSNSFQKRPASGCLIAHPCSSSPNVASGLPKSKKIFQLNEEVAYELRDMRSVIEEKYRVNKVTFKEHKCIRCRFLPWKKNCAGKNKEPEKE